MRFLAIETATGTGSVALWDDHLDRLDAVSLGPDRDHGRRLALAVERLVEGSVETLDAYAIAIGPGSFTGLRVGLAFVKGLALAHPRPALPISTLALVAEVARRIRGPGSVLAVLDARNDEVFARLEPSGALAEGLYGTQTLAGLLTAEAPGIIAGDRVPALEAVLPGWSHLELPAEPPLAAILAQLAAPRLLAGDGVDPQPLEPAYLQAAAVDRRRSVTQPSPPR